MAMLVMMTTALLEIYGPVVDLSCLIRQSRQLIYSVAKTGGILDVWHDFCFCKAGFCYQKK